MPKIRAEKAWQVIKKAKEEGRYVLIGPFAYPNRTKKHEELYRYLLSILPKWDVWFYEHEAEEVYDWVERNGMTAYDKEIGYSHGRVAYVIPVTEQIQVEMVRGDEHEADEETEGYVYIQACIITERTTKEDVEQMVKWLKELRKASGREG